MNTATADSPIRAWLEDEDLVKPNGKAYIKRLYDYYKKTCDEKNPMKVREFTANLRRICGGSTKDNQGQYVRGVDAPPEYQYE